MPIESIRSQACLNERRTVHILEAGLVVLMSKPWHASMLTQVGGHGARLVDTPSDAMVL
jgi:hypothetical protein